MPKAIEVIRKIEEFAPLTLQESYDNSGLQIGDINSEVTGIYIAVNIDLEVIKDAVKNKCNFILTHHPIIFNPIYSISTSTYQGKVLTEAIKNNLIVYAGHTSVDNAGNSIAENNLKNLGCHNIHKVNETYIADIDTVVSKIVSRLARNTGDENILATNMTKKVNRVAHINGSGGRMDEILPMLIEQRVDAFISSELKYSFLLDLTNSNIAVIELNHFNSERIFIEIMNNILCTRFDNVVMSKINQNPYNKE